jgi:nicotinamide mononucleotide transporter
MSNMLWEWLSANYIEVLGAILGIAYIIFSIRQSIFTWPAGLATSLLYIIVFFQSKFYADMGLQFYYVFISIYGWHLWLRGNPENKSQALPVKRITHFQVIYACIFTLLIFGLIYIILINFTDSPLPIMDSATTALSIVATFMLARKILEHWIIWIVVDLTSAGLYIYKDLWPTVILFLIYTIMAYFGYREWKISLKLQRDGYK